MKTLLIAGMLLATSVSHALEFSLNCATDDGHALPIKVVKAPFKNPAGKWDNKFFIESSGGRVELGAAGSGDEDYSEYKVASPVANISGASVQNHFKWASLVNVEGSSFARCE